MQFAHGKGPAIAGTGLVSTTLAEEVLRAVVLSRIKAAVVVAILSAFLVAGGLLRARSGRNTDGDRTDGEAPVAQAAPGPGPAQQPPQADEPRLVKRRVQGIVRDENGRPAPRVWFGHDIRPREDTWRTIELERIRERHEPFRDTQGRVVPPGPLGKYFEIRDDQGYWKPVAPGDVRLEDASERRPPAPRPHTDVGKDGRDDHPAQPRPDYLLRTTSGKWMVPPSSFSDFVADRTDAEGRFSAEVLIDRQLGATQLLFATPDFSRQAIHVVHLDDPEVPVEVTLRPAREVRTPVIEVPEDHPDEEFLCTVYTVEPAHASPYNIPAIGTKGAVWGEFPLKSGPGNGPKGVRWLEARLPAGKYKVRFRSDTLYDVEDLVIPPGEGPIELPGMTIKTLAWVLMLGKPAAEIEAVDVDGKPAKLEDDRGKVVVLVFWTSKDIWFRPVPHLAKLRERFRDQPLSILAIHDASITSLATFRQVVDSMREQIGADTALRFLLDRPPGRQGRNVARQGGRSRLGAHD